MKFPAKLATRYRITNGAKFSLSDIDPADTASLDSKKDAKKMLRKTVEKISGLQETLYAHNQWAVLCVFQAIDAAGKDSTIEHVMSGVNPQGCKVVSFRAPTSAELDHDFLWRTTCALPPRGHIGIFNRSYYEEVLVVRVHPKILAGQRIPEKLIANSVWEERFEDINAFETHLARNGVAVRKFFLHVSKEEQKRRFLARLDRPEKNWKFEAGDLHERDFWDDYMHACEETIRHTATPDAPWHVIPADHKWFTRLAVAAAILETLESLELKYPELSAEQAAGLAEARERLTNEE